MRARWPDRHVRIHVVVETTPLRTLAGCEVGRFERKARSSLRIEGGDQIRQPYTRGQWATGRTTRGITGMRGTGRTRPR